MARKKSRTPDTTSSKSKDFSNNPFRDLKGLSVCSKATSRESRIVLDAPSPAPAPQDEILFLEEMALLQVRPARESTREEHESPSSHACQDEIVQTGGADAEQALFLQTLGQLDRTFEDELPEEPVVPQASPRRMRELNRGARRPEAELDLHGLDRNKARERVRHFLENARHHGLQTVLIITGAGLHSPEGPVLRTEIEKFLAEQGRLWAVEWGRAPRRYGGAGALVVFMKK